jgi:hydrogenase/urease accessory protein HupE
MSAFSFYFPFGWHHIISMDALDHLLFIIALGVLYSWSNWKKVLVLITAFTVGHSLTLFLSSMDWIRLDAKWVEFFIPLTIMITAYLNLFHKRATTTDQQTTYWLALCFGFIHGMGFANSIRFMLAQDQQIGWSLLGFNMGLEVGQCVVMIALLSINQLVIRFFNIALAKWGNWVSGLVLGIAAVITFNRFPIQF